jgi:capsular polysaccharide transport system permease protein
MSENRGDNPPEGDPGNTPDAAGEPQPGNAPIPQGQNTPKPQPSGAGALVVVHGSGGQGGGAGRPQGDNRPKGQGQNRPGQQGQNRPGQQGQNRPGQQGQNRPKGQGGGGHGGGGGPRLIVGAGGGKGGAARQVQPTVPVMPPEPSVFPEPGPTLAEMQRARKRRFFLRLALFVGLPTLVTLLYTLLWATPRYVATAEVTYETYRPQQSLASGLIQSVTGATQNSSIDYSTIIYEYVRSTSLLAKLDKKLDLKGYYSKEGIDYLSRLSPTASRENLLNYYHSRVSVTQGLGGYLTIQVTAFDSEYAVKLARAVVKACDEMVDDMSLRAREDETQSAVVEVEREEDRVRRARKALTEFQNLHGDLDPQRMATDLGQIVGHLESDLSAAHTELTNDLAYMRADAPKVAEVKYKIAALENQLKQERERLANKQGDNSYAHVLDDYTALKLEEEFARNAYQAAQQGLAVARAEAGRKENYLVAFAPPNEPDKPTFYFPLYYTLTAFFGSLLAFGIGSLIIRAFRDQAGL